MFICIELFSTGIGGLKSFTKKEKHNDDVDDIDDIVYRKRKCTEDIKCNASVAFVRIKPHNTLFGGEE